MKRLAITIAIASTLACMASVGWADAPAPTPAVPLPPSYTLIWSDEFDHPEQFPGARWNEDSYAVSDRWSYKSEMSRVADGHLHIEARSDRSGRMTAGRVNTMGRFAHGPAYYEIRARVDSTPGLRAVVRLMSSELGQHVDNPGEGGADVELLRLEPSPRRIFQGVYWNPYAGTIMPADRLPADWKENGWCRPFDRLGGDTNKVEITRDPRSAGGIVDAALLHEADPEGNGFHVYGLLWTGDGYRFFVDGQLTQLIRDGLSGVPLYVEAWIEGHFQQGRTARSATLELDYVRVFAPPASPLVADAKKPQRPSESGNTPLILPLEPTNPAAVTDQPLTPPVLETTPKSELSP